MNYKVPFVDYPAHYLKLKNEILRLLDDVLFTRADLILRDDVKEFETNISSFLGAKCAVGVNSCTDAMHLSLHAAGVEPGDEVITVDHTFVATVEAIIHCGAKPILVDITEDFNMDVEQLERAVSPRTKAIVPVHLNGRVCNMRRIMAIAKKYSLVVIEDAAQSLGAIYNGRKAGTFGLAGCFSFFPAKILGAAGDGGLICTNRKNFAEKIRLLRDHGRKGKNDIVFYGFNSRLDNIQAAILNLKLKDLPKWIERRRKVAAIYHNGLKDVNGIKLPPEPNNNQRYFDVFQNYVIRAKSRNALVKYLRNRSVETLISWPKPMHKHKRLNLQHFRLPMTERISKEVVSLPMNAEISNEQVEYVIEHIREFYAR